MNTVLLFAYNPRQHGMIRERVPAELVEAREIQLRTAGWEIGYVPLGTAPQDVNPSAVTLLTY